MFSARNIWAAVSVAALIWGWIYLTPKSLHSSFQPTRPVQSVPLSLTNYRYIVCPGDMEKDIQEPPGNNFTITLAEGCFGPLIRLPQGWHDWKFEQIGNNVNYFSAFWFERAQFPEGPFITSAKSTFPYHPSAFRLQGHGQLLFYTDSVPPTDSK